MSRSMGRTAAMIAAAAVCGMTGCGGTDSTQTVRPGGGARAPSGGTSTAKAAVAAEGWGTLKGRFVFDGQASTPQKINLTKVKDNCDTFDVMSEQVVVGPGGGIKNVVVFLRIRDVRIHPDYEANLTEQVPFANKGCRFEPHVQTVWWSKQTLVISNADPNGHNTKLEPPLDQAINPILPAGGSVDYNFTRDQLKPVKAVCNIHPWMGGYLLPRDNPYAAVSGDDGSFELANLPAGTLEFQVWHEKSDNVTSAKVGGQPVTWDRGRATFTIEDGQVNDLGDIHLTLE